jgi:hypothetical protein
MPRFARIDMSVFQTSARIKADLGIRVRNVFDAPANGDLRNEDSRELEPKTAAHASLTRFCRSSFTSVCDALNAACRAVLIRVLKARAFNKNSLQKFIDAKIDAKIDEYWSGWLG